MFDYLSGTATDKKNTEKGYYITIDIMGIGYFCETTEHDYTLCKLNENCKLYTTLIHREDAMLLYGFLKKETRDIFQILLSVSGVGVKMAIALLNQFDIYNLITFVVNGDYKELTLAKGVGTKLAQKIILELKDKLIKTDIATIAPKSKGQEPLVVSEAKTIMLSLGYNEDEINNALSNVEVNEKGSDTESILREALLKLSL